MATQLSIEHKLMLAVLVRDNKHLLFNKLSPTITNKKKHAKWTEIYHELASNGAIIKDVEHLKKVKIKSLVYFSLLF